jgi:hypothetical protein
MANLVITSTASTVVVDFGIYARFSNIKKASFRRDEISEIIECNGGVHITIEMLDGNSFDVSFNKAGKAMIVDTIDGVTPTDNDNLFDILHLLQQT